MSYWHQPRWTSVDWAGPVGRNTLVSWWRISVEMQYFCKSEHEGSVIPRKHYLSCLPHPSSCAGVESTILNCTSSLRCTTDPQKSFHCCVKAVFENKGYKKKKGAKSCKHIKQGLLKTAHNTVPGHGTYPEPGSLFGIHLHVSRAVIPSSARVVNKALRQTTETTDERSPSGPCALIAVRQMTHLPSLTPTPASVWLWRDSERWIAVRRINPGKYLV